MATQSNIHYTKNRAWNPNPVEDDDCPICQEEESDQADVESGSDEDADLSDDPDSARSKEKREGKLREQQSRGQNDPVSKDPNDHQGNWIEGRWMPAKFQYQERTDALGFQINPKKEKHYKGHHESTLKNLLVPSESETPDFSQIPKSAPVNTILVMPRGIQILAKNRNFLEKGFHYPKELQGCGISKDEWNAFCFGFTSPIRKNKHWKTAQPLMAYEIENMLDLVADWDLRFFRPRGYVMRLDMPGEQKYGLDFMDIHHSKAVHKHFDNVEFSTKDRVPGVTLLKPRSQNHRKRVRERAFTYPRIVIDSIEMLVNGRAQGRGWTHWIRACQEAWQGLVEQRQMDCNEPSHFAKLERRKDRWPASKLLFADRFRGREVTTRDMMGHYSTQFIPDPESMDQRAGTRLFPKSVVACDDIYFKILKRGGPEDHGRWKPFGMFKCPEVRNEKSV